MNVMKNAQKNVQNMIVKMHVTGNYLGQIHRMEQQQDYMERMHMTAQKEKMAAINAINSLLNILSRSILIYYAVATFIGITWFIGTLNTLDILSGYLFVISASIVGLSCIDFFKRKTSTLVYIMICLAGITSSLFMIIKYYFVNYGNPFDYLEQLTIIMCFVIMIIRKTVIL